jgi:hypothetical protein
VRKIQAAFPCQEKLATNRRHCIVEIDLRAGGTSCLRGHEPGRPSTDYGNLHLSFIHEASFVKWLVSNLMFLVSGSISAYLRSETNNLKLET